LLVGVVEASAQKAPAAKPFERFDGCVLTPDEWTDGHSFRVRMPDGRLETFRLYFVDTTESRSRGKRSDEQAAYFGLTRAEAVKLGEEAKAFTAAALQRPFTIQHFAVVAGQRYTTGLDQRPHGSNTLIRVYDEAGDVIATHEHAGDFKEP